MAVQPARWRRWSRFAWRAVVLGLQHYGATSAGVVLRPPPAAEPGPFGPPYGPPFGHPERLAIDLPLSTIEAQLWAQLGHHAGL